MNIRASWNLAAVLLLSALFSTSLFAQLSTTEIDQLVEEAMETFKVAGVALGVVKDGQVVHCRGYGQRSVDSGEPVDAQTAFAIASNSKAFTSCALALLVEEGKLSWTDRVIDHIPEFRMYNDYVTRNFNVQDLLTHRSGLGLGAGDLQKWPSGSDFSIEDMLVNFQYFEPQSAFRTRYDYDNILYLVAGELIKRLSGMPWEDFVRIRILEPLDMKHSYTLPPSLCGAENIAAAHLAREGRLRVIPYYEFDPEKINGAAGGVLSCAEDLCRWMLLHLNAGKYGSKLEKNLFSPESQREMWKIHTTIKVRPDDRYKTRFSGYGLGWRISDVLGLMTISHTGDLSGMLSKTYMIPDMNLGVVVLTNSYYGGAALFKAVSQTIVDAYLGLEDANWTEVYRVSEAQSSARSQAVVDAVWETVETGEHNYTPADFTGIYVDPWFGKVEVSLKNKQLWFRSLRSPKLNGPMYHYKANSFAIKWLDREMDADAFAIFSLDEEGRAVGLKMKGISPDIDFSYDFQDLNFNRSKN
ncbi:MAG: serine hydrolase [Bacteroidetes bacterium]|nr:MAG: serine hydrolase [Bacteroidota bacterium]